MNRILSKLKELFETYTDYVVVKRHDISVMLAAYEDLEERYTSYQAEVGDTLVSFVDGMKRHQEVKAELESSRALAATHHEMYAKSLDEAQVRIAELEAALISAEHGRISTHSERNHLVIMTAHMARMLGWRAGVGVHSGDSVEGFGEVVRIDTPVGQLSWHIHDSQRAWLENLPPYEGTWDGSSRTEKYARIRELFGRV